MAPVPGMLPFFFETILNPSGVKIHSYQDGKEICSLCKCLRLDNSRSGCQISNTWPRIIIIMREHIAHHLWSNQNNPQALPLCPVASARAEMVGSGRGRSWPLWWSTAGLGSSACRERPIPKWKAPQKAHFNALSMNKTANQKIYHYLGTSCNSCSNILRNLLLLSTSLSPMWQFLTKGKQ